MTTILALRFRDQWQHEKVECEWKYISLGKELLTCRLVSATTEVGYIHESGQGYSRAKGAFAGVSIDGASIRTRDDLNKGYYGAAE